MLKNFIIYLRFPSYWESIQAGHKYLLLPLRHGLLQPRAERATDGMFGRIKPSINLDVAPFNFGGKHKGHSAQFRSTIQRRWKYWTQALEDLGLDGQ